MEVNEHGVKEYQVSREGKHIHSFTLLLLATQKTNHANNILFFFVCVENK